MLLRKKSDTVKQEQYNMTAHLCGVILVIQSSLFFQERLFHTLQQFLFSYLEFRELRTTHSTVQP